MQSFDYEIHIAVEGREGMVCYFNEILTLDYEDSIQNLEGGSDQPLTFSF